MSNQQKGTHADIGMIGLGVMGRNLLLNMADHGYSVAGYDKDPAKVASLRDEAGGKDIYPAGRRKTFLDILKRPRKIILLVPAGEVVDSVIKELLPYLDKGDLIVDAGNSHYTDTDRRIDLLEKKEILFMGMGVSGGEEGARFGPSIMPGGSMVAFNMIKQILGDVAARVNNEPCMEYMGKGSAGHFVKMVHNGIEYAIMQLISETYDIMKRGLGLNNTEIHELFTEWNTGKLNSFLVEITGLILSKKDEKKKSWLIDEILDVARQKGTGMWTTLSAMELQIPVPTIDMAVAMRDLSAFKEERIKISAMFNGKNKQFPAKMSGKTGVSEQEKMTGYLKDALYCSVLLSYSQGFSLLGAASAKFKYQLSLQTIAKIWRGGCIIRSVILDDIKKAYSARNLQMLLLDPAIAGKISENQEGLRQIVSYAGQTGIPAPAMMASLGYLDSFRSDHLPANLIQAERDYFGSHTYERIDKKGIFHTQWDKI